MADQTDTYMQAERHHEERRQWHHEALARDADHAGKHRRATSAMLVLWLVRALVEIAILVVLIAHWWA